MQIKIAYIEAFNAMAEQLKQRHSGSLKLTPEQCGYLYTQVNEIARRTGRKHATIWRELKSHFKVATYREIKRTDFQEACRLLDIPVPVENTVTFRQPTQPINLKPLLWHALMCAQFIRKHEAAIRMFNRRLAASICDHANDGIACIRNVAAEIGEPLPAREFFDYYPWGEDSETVRRYRELSLPQYLK